MSQGSNLRDGGAVRVDLALLGDYASVDKMDKLSVAGIFTSIVAPTVPCQHPTMFLALTMTVEAGDDQHHDIVVRLIDPDGHQIIPELRGELDVQRKNPADSSTLNLVLQMNGVPFRTFGTHCFDIFVDDRFMERVPIEVIRAKIDATGSPSGQ